MVLNNGVVLTVDKNGFIYDFSHFIPPYKITLNGGQFLAEEEKLVTIDDNGFLYRKDKAPPKKIAGKGANYIIAENGEVITFDVDGFLYKYEKNKIFRKAESFGFGGLYFTVKTDEEKPSELYTINMNGNYFAISLNGLNPTDITIFGGNFFRTKQGIIYTVSKAGFVFDKSTIKTASLKKNGGNYFIDANNLIYTISSDGFLIIPSLPASFKPELISKFGSNYMIDSEGRVFVVDALGNVLERAVTGHDLRNVRVLSF
jgi:hypothetical protein